MFIVLSYLSEPYIKKKKTGYTISLRLQFFPGKKKGLIGHEESPLYLKLNL